MVFARHSRALGALLLSAAAAAVVADQLARSPSHDSVAAAAVVERIESGHALVDNYLDNARAARLAANREADAQLAMSRHQAAAEAALRVAEARAPSKATPSAAVTPLPLPSPLAVQPPPPQQLAQDTAPQPEKRPVLARVVSTVTRIPGWVGSSVVGAASWVADLPGQVVRLPERRFL